MAFIGPPDGVGEKLSQEAYQSILSCSLEDVNTIISPYCASLDGMSSRDIIH